MRCSRPDIALAAVALVATTLAIASPVASQPRGALIASCAACHGEDGIARAADVPHIAGQNVEYMMNQMAAFRSGRRRHPEMNFMARELSQRDIADIVNYYAGLPPR
jgi:cytochrome c553